jgi:uncharacterized membrane protein
LSLFEQSTFQAGCWLYRVLPSPCTCGRAIVGHVRSKAVAFSPMQLRHVMWGVALLKLPVDNEWLAYMHGYMLRHARFMNSVLSDNIMQVRALLAARLYICLQWLMRTRKTCAACYAPRVMHVLLVPWALCGAFVPTQPAQHAMRMPRIASVALKNQHSSQPNLRLCQATLLQLWNP